MSRASLELAVGGSGSPARPLARSGLVGCGFPDHLTDGRRLSAYIQGSRGEFSVAKNRLCGDAIRLVELSLGLLSGSQPAGRDARHGLLRAYPDWRWLVCVLRTRRGLQDLQQVEQDYDAIKRRRWISHTSTFGSNACWALCWQRQASMTDRAFEDITGAWDSRPACRQYPGGQRLLVRAPLQLRPLSQRTDSRAGHWRPGSHLHLDHLQCRAQRDHRNRR